MISNIPSTRFTNLCWKRQHVNLNPLNTPPSRMTIHCHVIKSCDLVPYKTSVLSLAPWSPGGAGSDSDSEFSSPERKEEMSSRINRRPTPHKKKHKPRYSDSCLPPQPLPPFSEERHLYVHQDQMEKGTKMGNLLRFSSEISLLGLLSALFVYLHRCFHW